MGKESGCSARDTGDKGSILGLGRSPGEGHGTPLQYSCLGNPMNRGAWQVTLHEVAESDMTERPSTRAQAADGRLIAGPVGSSGKLSPSSDFREVCLKFLSGVELTPESYIQTQTKHSWEGQSSEVTVIEKKRGCILDTSLRIYFDMGCGGLSRGHIIE